MLLLRRAEGFFPKQNIAPKKERWATALFLRYCAHERKAKNKAQKRKKKEREKAKCRK
jgi:hypothetical protein